MYEGFREVADSVKLFPSSVFINKEYISLREYSQIDDFVFFNGGKNSVIGRNVHISAFTSIIGGGEFYLGDFSGLSAGCRIITGSDDFSGISLNNPTIPREYRETTIGTVTIGRHVLVGSNVVIMPNVVIGDGCIVSAGAIVNKNLEPWSIYVGYNPKKVSSRNKSDILKLEEKYLNGIKCIK
jgi:acetyltransferase-like isoleucine patch superfamily enzyme